MIFFFLGSALITLGMSYALFTKLRVVRLKEDLFAIRDDLFDAAAGLGRLNDPAYQSARSALNSFIGGAHLLTVPLYLYSMNASHKPSGFNIPVTDSPELEAAMEDALNKFAERVLRYLLFETVTGCALRLLALCKVGQWRRGAAYDAMRFVAACDQ